jgi:hypothetical protein
MTQRIHSAEHGAEALTRDRVEQALAAFVVPNKLGTSFEIRRGLPQLRMMDLQS